MITTEKVKEILGTLELADKNYIVGLKDYQVFPSLKTVKKLIDNSLDNIDTRVSWCINSTATVTIREQLIKFLPNVSGDYFVTDQTPFYFEYDPDLPNTIILNWRYASDTQDGVLSKTDFSAFAGATFSSKPKNTFYAGPITGADAPPSFRVFDPTNDIITSIPTNKGGTGMTTIGSAGQFLRVNGFATGLAYAGILDSDLPTVPVNKGGTGLTSLGSALQILRVNSGATALEYATIGGITGLTSGRIPYASGATSLLDTSNLRWDNVLQSLALGSVSLPAAAAAMEIQPLSTRAAIRLYDGTPASPANGEIWYRNTNTEFFMRGNLNVNGDITRNAFGGASATIAYVSRGHTSNLIGMRVENTNISTPTLNGFGHVSINSNTFSIISEHQIVSSRATPSFDSYGGFTSLNGGSVVMSNYLSSALWPCYTWGLGRTNPTINTNTITQSNNNIALHLNQLRFTGRLGSNTRLFQDVLYITNQDSGITAAESTEISLIVKHGHAISSSNSNAFRATNFAWAIIHTEGTSSTAGSLTNTNGYGLVIGGIHKRNTGNVTNGNLYAIYIKDYSGTTVTPQLGYMGVLGAETNISLYEHRWGLFIEGTAPTNVASYIGHRVGIALPSQPSAVTGITALLDVGASTTSLAAFRIRSGAVPTTPLDGSFWYDGTDLWFQQGATSKRVSLI